MTRPQTKPWYRPPQPGTPVWLAAGSGPSAAAGMLAALDEYHPQVTITTNAGYRLFTPDTIEWPTFYFLSDSVACDVYNDRSSLLQAAHGTMVLTPERVPSAIKHRRMEHADQFIVTAKGAKAGVHTPGLYAGQPISGMWIVDIALNRGAETLILVGFDGYRSSGEGQVVDYFDGRRGHARNAGHTKLTAAHLASAVKARPSVQFVMFGDPVYEVPEAKNFRLVRIGQEVTA